MIDSYKNLQHNKTIPSYIGNEDNVKRYFQEKNKMEKPMQTFRAGNVSASIWKNEYPIKGTEQKGVNYSVTLQRSYKDGEEWKNTNSFNRDDIPKAKKVLSECYDFIFSVNE